MQANIQKDRRLFTKNFIAIVLLFAFSVWKFYPSFSQGLTVSIISGDGLGTIAWMNDLAVKAQNESISFFYSDLTKLDGSGLGAWPAVPINSIQKILIYIISLFTQSDNVYDIYAFFGFFFVGVSSYFLLKEFKVNSFFAFFGSFLLLNIDTFYARINGHLTLAIPFAPILLTLATVQAAKVTDLKQMLILAVLMCFNFSMNEYYGYFGAFYSVSLFLGLYFYYNPLAQQDLNSTKKLAKNALFACLFFILLMVILYPNLIGTKLISIFNTDITDIIYAEESPVIRGHYEFLYYSVKNPLYMFFSQNEIFKQIIDFSYFQKDVLWEQSFRVGLIIPLFLSLFLLSFLIKRRDWTNDHRIYLFFAFTPALILIFLFSNDPRNGPSLVNFTYEFTKIFRVSTRAHLYIVILLITIFVIYLDIIYKNLSKKVEGKKFAYFLMGLMLIFTLDDTIKFKLWSSQIPIYQLPDASFYEDLAKREPGRVLEIPFHHSPEDPPESGYLTNYFRSIYQFELVNAVLPSSNPAYKGYTHLYNILKKPSSETIAFLQDIGVKYIVVNSSAEAWRGGSNQMVLLNQLAGKKLFKLAGAKVISKEEALQKIKTYWLLTIPQDEEVLFSDKNSKVFEKQGFSYTEDWGVWSNSKKAEIIFTRAERESSSLNLIFRTFGSLQHKQNIIFYVNGEKALSLDNIQPWVEMEEKLIIDEDQPEMITIRMEIPTAISPNELDANNQDTRKLGIGLIKMKYQKEKTE